VRSENDTCTRPVTQRTAHLESINPISRLQLSFTRSCTNQHHVFLTPARWPLASSAEFSLERIIPSTQVSSSYVALPLTSFSVSVRYSPLHSSSCSIAIAPFYSFTFASEI